VLYQVLADWLETFLLQVDLDETRASLPSFVRQELRAYLDCGILAKGFARVHCKTCGKDGLVAFSCKKRGICPSCGARRMVDQAAHWVDCVLPDVPIRQWVLSLPYIVRYRIGFDPELLSAVRRTFMRGVQSFVKRRLRDLGVPDGRTGAVVCVQRYDSALRLDPHFHALVLDGVYTDLGLYSEPRFHALPRPAAEDIRKLTRSLSGRILKLLRRRGALDAQQYQELGALELCQVAAVQGRIPFGEGAGQPDPRPGRHNEPLPPRTEPPLCAEYGGFSLHAATRVPAGHRNRLERLCRYLLRPAIATERLSLTPRGKVRYAFKKAWRDGSVAVEMSPLTFISRLAALIPAPRANLVTYHGLLAPAASYRDQVIPEPTAGLPTLRDPKATPVDGATRLSKEQRRRKLLWAEAMKRGLGLDVLACEHCGGRREVLTFLTDPLVITKILDHLGLPSELPPIRAARPPPGSERMFGA